MMELSELSWNVGDVVRITGLANQTRYNDKTAVIETICLDGKLGLRIVGGTLLKISNDKVQGEDCNRTQQARREYC
jgi:hypothetical protein